LNIRILILTISFFSFTEISTIPKIEVHNTGKVYAQESLLFNKAVELIKRKEGWHDKRHKNYVGYGHKLLKGETFGHDISEEFADSILRRDLLQKCSVFRKYGRDSLLLGVLAYNVGEYNILGHKNKPASRLIQKIRSRNRDFYDEYVSFCRYKNKVIPSIKQRRMEEFELLYIK
jgi:GH24 family phage-related lysozyme (muramidase)